MMATATRRNPDAKLIWTILANLAISVVEVTGGLFAGSLSLWSDALHNTSDAFSLFISLIGVKLSRRGNTELRTFGYKRAEILAALLNASLLMIVSFFLFKEAWARLAHPPAVNSSLMMAVAGGALAANCGSMLLLRRHTHDDMNIRASYFHLISDALSSLSVIVGGACVHFWGWNSVDPLLTLGIGLFVLVQGYGILNRAVRILMQSAPEDLDLYEIQRVIEELADVDNIHHVHLWQMTERDVHFEGHINVSRDMTLSDSARLKENVERLLRDKYRITHSTLQFEYGRLDMPLVNP